MQEADNFGQELIEPLKLALFIDIHEYSVSTKRESLPPSGDEKVFLQKLLGDHGFKTTVIRSTS